MPKKSSAEHTSQLYLELLWSLWSELGVPGWPRHHQSWSIDPEALLLVTAAWAGLDARLREEALEWTVRYESFLSAGRFKTLLKSSPALSRAIQQGAGSKLLADLRASTQLQLPGETSPNAPRLRRQEQALDVTRPAQISLRLRALFGVGVRAEVMRIFLTKPRTDLSAAELVDLGVGFTKRAIQNVLDDLVLAGVLRSRRRGNTALHRLTSASPLKQFTPEVELEAPRWAPLFEFLEGTRGLEIPRRASTTSILQLRSQARSLDQGAKDAELPAPPHKVRGDAFLPALQTWKTTILQDLAAGRWPAE